MALYRFCRYALLLACVCAAVAVSGCGASKADVSGTIKIQGQAPKLQGLQLTLLGGNGAIVSAPINPDGTYKAIDVPVGEVKVAFIYFPQLASPTPGKGKLPQAGPQGAPPVKGDVSGTAKPETKNPIPEPLRDGSTSKISFRVVSGNNVFDYDVKP
jgi:hypothetical protein